MANFYAHSLLKQQNFPESFQFYFKNNQQNRICDGIATLQDLIRPRLKIAIVTETWSPEINGVALSLLQLCKGLQQQGHKILLIRPEQKQKCHEFLPNHECLVKAQAIPQYPSLQFGWPQFLKVSNALDKFAPNVVHIVTEGPLGLSVLQAAKTKGIPVSSGFHSPFQEFSRYFDLAFLIKPIQRYLRWFHNNTQLTCIPSKDTEYILRQFGVCCPLVVVGRGVDIARFSPQHCSDALRQQWGATSTTKVMLYVGRLSPEKEIDVLIKAYRSMKKNIQQDIKLVIVGDGPERGRLEMLSQGQDVVFTGNLSGLKLAQAYASANVFVFASQVETFGNVVLEAMASGLPVIAYDYACAHLHVKNSETGWLSALGDTTSFIQSIYQLPNNRQLKQMGLQAREAVQHIGWQHPVQQFEQALYGVAMETEMTS
ncbi:glycosyltransferase family 4 protein [Acinetobacter bouvetii]|uniref:GDP-mannose-dependent alpha-mannosyltransferase n=1 Tax=Acinetobacter bouvetii TaxID=202951 RepID=A0A811G869_9GAMM|nr:glycosyltransferase family 1 protein [Acinetobacter bouvetii]CAB1208532.1 GDP-mannose-dependent alpha-mannosyltransferase [Acinetobacter bouvetii]